MWEEIYVWIESYSGCSYDMTKDIDFITDMNTPFVETFEWRLTAEKMVDDLSSIYDIITEYHNLIPDTLPSESKMKKMFAEQVLGAILQAVNNVKKQLHIQQIDITDHNVLLLHVDKLTDLINLLSTNTLDDIIEKKKFDKYNEENDDAFTDLFGLTSSDMSNMFYTISSIKEAFGSDDEDINDIDEE